MENCTIYSHQIDFQKVLKIIQDRLPKATIESSEGGGQKTISVKVKGGFFSAAKTLNINYRERLNPSYTLESVDCPLSQNLAGMANYVQSLPSQNSKIKNLLIIKIKSLNSEMSFMGKPEITDKFYELLKVITNELDAIVFAQAGKRFNKSNGQHFLDKNLQLILDPQGHCEINDLSVSVDAKYHDQPKEEYEEEQIIRKSNSETFLQQKGIKVNANLPCIPSASMVQIRSKEAIAERAFALLIMAVKGEGIEQEHLDRTIADKQINSFTPKEKEIIYKAVLDDKERANATWRYESLNVLLWALGKIEALVYPSSICNVEEVVGAIFKPTRADFLNSIQLRSPAQILDELDKVYRMHWACVDARIHQQAVGGSIHPSIIFERHYALNWLNQYQNQDWDDVQTDT